MTKRTDVIVQTVKDLRKVTAIPGTVVYQPNGGAYYLVPLYSGVNGPLTEEEKYDIDRKTGSSGRVKAGPGSTTEEMRAVAEAINAALEVEKRA